MNEAGVSYDILGNREEKSGDIDSRIGNENLLQEIAETNIKRLEINCVTKIVTIDPHAYNIFKNEYPDFGYEAEVYHHTQLLYDLFFSSRRRHTRLQGDWSSDVCSSDLSLTSRPMPQPASRNISWNRDGMF